MLEVSTTATASEIKKSFYKLSKAHHPDLHPNDPSASQKFVKISEAYSTLGSAEKKARYDRDFLPSQQQATGDGYTPRGSYSSSGPGGRPASGLSRRRTQFRGPPPSFYRSGGWGEHSEKRSENASKFSHTHEAQGNAASGPAGPGMGPGGFTAGFDDDVPHFNSRAHHQTHSEIERRRQRARRRQERQYAEAEEGNGGGSVLFNFFLLTGVLAVASGISAFVNRGSANAATKKHEDDG